ncbi:nicotinate-nucleotide--dimethylbenzimidazole phosphoribosyltransferase [Streptomyces sp. NPDC088258]|uniref:nicotinate-nucleotide--dimethylbenzimidazole phosphoribosyltransferase n=1 Tax=Streptomyces sp. NPDC088258 TaxID=3365849 RepID=UPI00382ED31B
MTDTGQVPGEGLPENAGMVEQPDTPAPGTYTYLDSAEPVPEDEGILLMPSVQGGWNNPQVIPAETPAYAAPAGYGVPEGYAAPEGYAPAPEGYAVQDGYAAPAEAYAVPEQPGVEPLTPQAAPIEQPAPPAEPVPPVQAEGLPQAPDVYETPPESAAAEQPQAPAEPEQPPHQPGAHEAGGRDTGSVDLNGVRVPAPAPAAARHQATAPAAAPAPARRPLHMGPPVPDPTGGVVRSLADRGPAGAPAQAVRTQPPAQPQVPPVAEPEHQDAPAEEPAVLPGPQLGEIPDLPTQPEPAAEPVAEAAPEPEPEPAPEGAVAEPEAVPEAVAPPEAVAEAPAAPEQAEPVEVAEAAEVAEVAAPEPEPEPAQEPEAEVRPEPIAPEPAAEEHPPAPVPEPEAAPEAQPEAAPEPAPVAAEAPVAVEPVPAVAAAETTPEPEQPEQPTITEQPVAPQQTAPEQPVAPEPEAPSEGTAAASGYDDAERDAVLRVMRERRDIRNGFRPDPIPHEVLLRVLEAAHTAPSVGHSQPWDFVVIRSAETRRAMHELAQRQRDAYANSLPKGRAKQFKELKIEAILDTPVNIVVTADPTRGGRHTLGRHTQPQMAPYSSALAVENLWLAARAEGLGVGWVSFFDEREMVRALGLPEHLEVVSYLCVGYVDEFPEEPELMQAGWSKRRPLSWVVHEETYGRRALPGEEPHDLLQETVAGIRPLDAKALGEAWERQKRMTKPAGALGMLEIISAQLSGLSRMCPPPIPEPAAVAIFAGDHGVHAQGVTPWPREVTGQMVANILGGGAVCNAFANQVGAEVCVVDVGVASDLPATPGLLPRKVRAGTADFTTGPALTREEVLAAIEVGIETARDLVAAGNKALLTGEMGIANTTVSAALISVYTGQDPAEITGRGTGINDEMHARKVDVVRRALDFHQPDPADPIGVLAAIGGLEHAALVGFLLGGASMRTPVLLDGVSAGAAALVARAVAPEALAACIAGHRSAEPGHVAALNKLGLRPLVDLDLRLGEGTGALLALPVIQSAARAMHEVATFDSAGVTEK